VTAIPIARLRASPLRRIALTIRFPKLAVAAIGGYLTLGGYLSFVLHAYQGDAYSRVANAYYVLFSRDPHLAAIGFVWNPLPSLFELVLLPAKGIFPALSRLGFAANIMSATFMGLSVVILNGILMEVGLRKPVRLALVGAFALHPLILYYGAIGTSEAPMIFFSLLACRYLIRYAASASTTSLVGVGVALAGAYLTRYEAIAGAVGAAVMIVALAFVRSPGTRRERLMHGAADVAVGLTPFLLAFAGWAIANWIIVGTPFSQFSSVYGNTAQMGAVGSSTLFETTLPLGSSIALATLRLAFLSLVIPLGVMFALWNLVRRKDARALAVAFVLGPMLAFDVLGYVFHVLAPWLRYFILVIPMGIVLIGMGLAPFASSSERFEAQPRPIHAHPRPVGRGATRFGKTAAIGLVLALAFMSIPVAANGMLNPVIATEEAKDFGPLLQDGAAADRPGQQLRTYVGEQVIAQYVDSMALPRGSVLLDVFLGFPIILKTQHPDTFVITPDRDFQRILADPAIFGVQYLLVPPNDGLGLLDAINIQYPSLRSRVSFATAIHVFEPLGTSLRWTLYRIDATSS
jgi:hypothetical protein